MLMKTNESMTLTRADFPQDFVWGVATSAYQIEGAVQEGGRGPSVWDVFCQKPGVIADASDGSRACEHYQRWESDVDLIASLGVNAYRFSVSWPRVQPLGEGAWNEAGFAFYDRLLSRLEALGIEAHLTLNHWDLPQALQEKGGWESRETCEHFVRYALEISRRFGSRVKSLCTHNEPWVIAVLGHEHGVFAPGIKSRRAAIQVAHHLLLSHGMALKAMREAGVKAALGIVLNLSPIYPASSSAADVAKARLDDGLNARWYLDPLFFGRYPADVMAHLGNDAPVVQAADMAMIAQPLDFLGVNYYTRNFASSGNPWDVSSTGNQVTDMGWEVYPQGLTELLCRLHADYPVPSLWVTENGAAFKDTERDGVVDDPDRVAYLQRHIQAAWNAREKGVPVGAYFAWSLMDNFEWASGYAKRFGLVYVNYQTQQRTLKSSAHWYSGFLKA
ncbi:GH1 family beta-glucosidase [Amphibiibacter pelophylacis]|uniref:GH1 family beta-glucosidase n=1 Tax=Amphibiibacter pelophylacis TaxID=1799477 RepID=A0ACC6P2E0_9BURK